MRTCIKSTKICIGRDCREFEIKGNAELCCLEEIKEEKEIVQNIIDTIDDCTRCKESLLKISSKLSYGANVINNNGEDELIEVLPLIKRFSLLVYEFREKILQDPSIVDLTCSFNNEIKGWLSYTFLADIYPNQHPIQRQSIVSDMNTVEMALGVCMLEEYFDESSLDDLFF